MRIPLQLRFLIVLTLFSFESEAIRIELAKPILYRKALYQKFDTRAVTPLTLGAILEALGKEEPENQELIKTALQEEDFKTHAAYVYLYPPLRYQNCLYYELALYKVSRDWLETMLQALKDSGKPTHCKAIKRIEQRLKSMGNEVILGRKGKSRKAAKAKRMLEGNEEEQEAVCDFDNLHSPQKQRRLDPEENLFEEYLRNVLGVTDLNAWIVEGLPTCLQ